MMQGRVARGEDSDVSRAPMADTRPTSGQEESSSASPAFWALAAHFERAATLRAWAEDTTANISLVNVIPASSHCRKNPAQQNARAGGRQAGGETCTCRSPLGHQRL